MRSEILEKGTAVYDGPLLWPFELEWAKDPKYPSGTRWYRSKERQVDKELPISSYAINKKSSFENLEDWL